MWNISPAFRAAIQSPVHTMTVKAQVLDTNFNVVKGGTFYDTGRTGEIQNYIVDGAVDADASRGTRRVLNLSLMNPNAEFTPNSNWGGLFYVDRLIRVWRGVLHASGEEELIPLGTFLIDSADVIAERNMSMVVLTGSDLWKKVNKAKFATATKWASGTPVQTVVKEMAELAGVTQFVIDDLSHRTTQTKTLQADLNYERGEVIGDELLSLGTAWGLDIYFDPLGRMVSEEHRLDRAAVWTYAPGDDSSLLTVKAAYKDELLYNHVLVAGTADEENPVFAEAKDSDPSSPTSVDKIGKRTYMYESSYIATVAQAQTTANKLLAENVKMSEDIELQTVCNPAYECSDVLLIREGEFTKIDRSLRIGSFTVPLSSSRQTIRLHRMVIL